MYDCCDDNNEGACGCYGGGGRKRLLLLLCARGIPNLHRRWRGSRARQSSLHVCPLQWRGVTAVVLAAVHPNVLESSYLVLQISFFKKINNLDAAVLNNQNIPNLQGDGKANLIF